VSPQSLEPRSGGDEDARRIEYVVLRPVGVRTIPLTAVQTLTDWCQQPTHALQKTK